MDLAQQTSNLTTGHVSPFMETEKEMILDSIDLVFETTATWLETLIVIASVNQISQSCVYEAL